MVSSKGLGHEILSLTIPYCQRGFKDEILATKVETFLLLYFIGLEEGGEVHMHSWKGTSAHKDHHTTLLLHIDKNCIFFSQFF